MKDIFVVMKFTIKEILKRKSFIISTCIMLAFIAFGINVPNIINALNRESGISKVLIVDDKGVFEGTLDELNKMKLGYELEITTDKLDSQDIKAKIKEQEVDEVILIDKDNKQVKITCVVKNTSSKSVSRECVDKLTSIYADLQISKLGLTNEQLEALYPDFEVNLKQLEEKDEDENGNMFVNIIVTPLLFYVVSFCALQVSSSITTEKTSKIIETLVTSTTPKTIVWGKTIGIGIVGVVQLCLMGATAVISAMVSYGKEFMEMSLHMLKITPFALVMTIVYFVLGYLIYALVYALTGSMVSRPEDVQAANTPVSMLCMVGFYLAYFPTLGSEGLLGKIAAIVPISSPFCMPSRIVTGLSSGKDVAISIAVLTVTIIAIAHIAIKVYSNAILNYGTKMSFKNIVALYRNR